MKQYLLLFVLLLPCASALQWSEVMFNPLGNDNNREFVELIGTESLQGCMIRDTSSADTLILLHQGTDVILILENESLVNMADATVYGVGAAIGNGLGNTYEELTISCHNSTILHTSYNTSLLKNFTEGKSVIFDNGWKTGPFNGTPGRKNPAPTPSEPDSNVSNKIALNNISQCKTTLAITLSKTTGFPGDHIGFTIVSDSFASYEASANGTLFANGNTIMTKEHSLILPNSSVKLVAYANDCARQRATRYINVEQPPMIIATAEKTLVSSERGIEPPPLENTMSVVTGAVVMDKDRNVIPWICLFGSTTIIASSIVFLQLLRREQH